MIDLCGVDRTFEVFAEVRFGVGDFVEMLCDVGLVCFTGVHGSGSGATDLSLR